MMPGTVRRLAVTGRRSLAAAALVVAVAVALPACAGSAESAVGESQAKVEAVAGSEVSRVTLTQRASERIGIKTQPLTEQSVPGKAKLVPYSAVIYDTDGDTWVFTMPEPLTYVREQVTVVDIKANMAYLSAGPAAGTAVVSTGASLLYGAELGVGE